MTREELAPMLRANIAGADLSDAVLTRANIADVCLANLPGGIPVIPDIHRAVYAAASQPGALFMGDWHTCETTHCRAGWVITLAGDEGKALEERLGPSLAAALIYMASDPTMGESPDWYCSNKEALDDMRWLAGGKSE